MELLFGCHPESINEAQVIMGATALPLGFSMVKQRVWLDSSIINPLQILGLLVQACCRTP